MGRTGLDERGRKPWNICVVGERTVAPRAPAVPLLPTYRRREPERTVLHRVVREQLPSFLNAQEVPAFVARTFQRFLECGVLASGFVRVRCEECRKESLVAFSCKDRSFCPSCTARRAAETAAHLLDAVLPKVPLRQFVLVMPFDLHLRLARDPALEARVPSAGSGGGFHRGAE